MQPPRDAAVVEFEAAQQGERLVADDVDDGAHGHRAVLAHAVQQRLQPTGRRLTVRVQKRQHLQKRPRWIRFS